MGEIVVVFNTDMKAVGGIFLEHQFGFFLYSYVYLCLLCVCHKNCILQLFLMLHFTILEKWFPL